MKFVARAFGPGRAGELKLRIRAQTCERDGLERTGRDAEIHGVPAVGLAHRRAEFDLDGKITRVIEGQHETVLLSALMRQLGCAPTST